MILNFFENVTSFDMPPQDAINHFTAKGLAPTWNWYQMLGQQHDTAFTVAKMMDLDLLNTVKGQLDKVIATGGTLDEFKENLIPFLQKKGWWGQQDIIGPGGVVNTVQLGSASRLETIFRTNLQSAYAAGHWDSIMANADDQPYLMYDAVDDYATRDTHKKLDQVVYPIGHPFWETYYPPNDYNCRCGVIQMDADEVAAMGLKIGKHKMEYYPWVSPLSGKTHSIPVGVGPGFNHNSGKSYLAKLKETQATKLGKMDTKSQTAAKKGIKATDDKATKKNATMGDIGPDARAQAKAAAKAKADALHELTIIALGQATKQASIKKTILAKWDKNGTSKALKDNPEELLAKVVEEAAKVQAQKEKTKALNGFKTKILDGKLPTAKQQQVFDSLDEADQGKVLAAIDAKKAQLAEDIAVPVAQAIDDIPVPPPQAPIKPKVAGVDTQLQWANMKQIGGQKGSNQGGLYYDQETGKQWYIKRPPSDAHARNEVLATRLYELAGVDVPNVQLMVGPGGELRVASQIIEDLQESGAKLTSGKIQNINEGFAVDAWLANWDVVGLSFDNMKIAGNKAIRLDTGGALYYRAMGANKGSAFGHKVPEIDTLRDPGTNPQAAKVFASVTDNDIRQGVARIDAITDAQLASVIRDYAPADLVDDLLATMLARKADLVGRFLPAKAVTKEQLKRAETRLKERVASAVTRLDDELTRTVKGMQRYYAENGNTYRAVDKERFTEAKATYENLIAHPAITIQTYKDLVQHYEPWILQLEAALAESSVMSGEWFKGWQGSATIRQDAIEDYAATMFAKVGISEEDGLDLLVAYAGPHERNGNIPNAGSHAAFERLHKAHKLAIATYTGSHYSEVNKALFKRKVNDRHQGYVDLLNEALELSDKYKGISSRGLRLGEDDFKRWIADHKHALINKQPVRYLNFQSSTKGENAAFTGNVIIQFESERGVHVNPISRNAGRENEVLFQAGSLFYVTHIKKQGTKLLIKLTDAPADAQVPEQFEFSE
ncbi:minor capsid protein [Salinimonas marina]|uniref:Minor capsid protein n=1 Tax=Salinimonas marina TaxID=2785918 RepID=A0A7S9HDV2_9ALTE|nr:phage minor head protein [Salinimonas marina]QPG06544.1 minor capsid protein [Salinimonas marina]